MTSEEENALLRARRRNDAEFRQRESATKARYIARKKAELAGESVPEAVALVRAKPADPTEPWLQLWPDLNRCEGIREEERLRKLVKETMEAHLETNKPKEARSEYGLADDYENDD
jgi:hypothetical protein